MLTRLAVLQVRWFEAGMLGDSCQAFHDHDKGIHLSTLGRGTSAKGEYLDMEVRFDNRVGFSRAEYHVDPAMGMIPVEVLRRFSDGSPVAVTFSTTNSTATAPDGYTATTAMLPWTADEPESKMVMIPVNPAVAARGARRIGLRLQQAIGAVIGEPRAEVVLHTPGDLDPCFDPDWVSGSVCQTVPDPDGNILLGGIFSQIAGQSHGCIGRLGPTGKLDSTCDASPGAELECVP